jgi:hypothetical protein
MLLMQHRRDAPAIIRFILVYIYFVIFTCLDSSYSCKLFADPIVGMMWF